MLLLIVSLVLVGVAMWEFFWLGYFIVCTFRVLKEEKLVWRTRKSTAERCPVIGR